MKRLIPLLFVLLTFECSAQTFHMKKSYTGYHYGVTNFDESQINQFVVGFNQMWSADLETGFEQYSGRELGLHFTTSGLRLIWGKKEDKKWTGSTDYAFGSGKDKNEAKFKNGIVQHMDIYARNHHINLTFGVAMKENKLWLEGVYCTNLGKVILEYGTEHAHGVTSYGTEYKLNGVYTANIKTMELGFQSSYKYKKYVFYFRALAPIVTTGPDEAERSFVDEKSTQPDPKNFPADYNAYVNTPSTFNSTTQGLQSTGFKGFSYGFGMFYLIGKDK
jgi:hypothetical protein